MSVRHAIEKYGGSIIFDYKGSSRQNRYITTIGIIAFLTIFALCLIYSAI